MPPHNSPAVLGMPRRCSYVTARTWTLVGMDYVSTLLVPEFNCQQCNRRRSVHPFAAHCSPTAPTYACAIWIATPSPFPLDSITLRVQFTMKNGKKITFHKFGLGQGGLLPPSFGGGSPGPKMKIDVFTSKTLLPCVFQCA